ncbi:MAG: hypothetical protein RR371_00565, partial [Bacteroides sp.]
MGSVISPNFTPIATKTNNIMRKMKLPSMLMPVALSIAFTSCSKENNEVITQTKVLVVIAHEGESD